MLGSGLGRERVKEDCLKYFHPFIPQFKLEVLCADLLVLLIIESTSSCYNSGICSVHTDSGTF